MQQPSFVVVSITTADWLTSLQGVPIGRVNPNRKKPLNVLSSPETPQWAIPLREFL